MQRVAVIFLGCCLLCAHARADRVHLTSGEVIEGKATRQGDKVVVQIDSGEVAVPADSVVRIESSTTDLQRVDDMLAKLKPGDTAGLLKIANFCRDHQLPAREQELLQRVLETEPDHAEARARLGFVRDPSGAWIKREDLMRAQGMVQYQGRWVSREEMLELERMAAETAAAQRERDRAEAEARKAQADADRAQQQADEAQAAQQPPAYAYPSYSYGYVTPYNYSAVPYARFGGGRCSRGGCGAPPAFAPPPPQRHASFPIAGVRDPFDYFR
jgi:hypothetical protein